MTRPGGDYDVSLNYRIEDELQHGKTSTAGMVKGAILNADAQPVAPSAFRLMPKISTSHRQGDERCCKRSFTPYRRSPFDRHEERSVTPTSGTPWQYRRMEKQYTPSAETRVSSLSEGKYNLLQKFCHYLF